LKQGALAASLLCVAIVGTQLSTAAAAGSGTDNSSSAAVTVPITVNVPIRTIETPGTSGQSGIVEIRVGKSAPFAVMLDTGSVGLRVFPGAWERKPGSVKLGSKKIATALAGSKVKGIVGRAPMTLNGVITALPVPFQYVNTTNPYIQQWTGRKIFGILGIGTGSGDLTNPLMAMPGNLGVSWSVHFERKISDRIGRLGSLVLGGQAPPETIMDFQSPFVGKNINGALLWNDHSAKGCWRFGVKPEWCGDTWFDSGFTKMRVKGRVFARLPQGADGLLRQGTRVEFAAPGSAYVGHRLVSGDQASRNYVRVLPKGAGVVNTGNSFYFDYTVTYNVAIGKIYLSKS
jgi:hypothetical protein